MALIGDAAHRIHPLAGQGLNIGITDVAYLANQIVKGKKQGSDIGNYDFVLKDYERYSKLNAYMMTASIEIVKNSYAGKVLGSQMLGDALAMARNAMTDVIDSSELLKYNFMGYASGNINHPVTYEWQTQ